MPATFDDFFQIATTPPGETPRQPYAYQRRLAGDTAGRPCESQLINIPTGLGKTAAVVLAWLWNRVSHPDAAHRETWPRRLVICLPMRTLVEQTRDEVSKWLSALAKASPENADLRWLAASGHSPIILMGGADAGEWDIHPERPAILIGTQDMLLSRALNRGYGANPSGDTKKGFGNVPFHRDEFTGEIKIFFNVDLAQIRGYGLGAASEELLYAISLFKVRALLDAPFRPRTACDLEVVEGSIDIKKPAGGYQLPSLPELSDALPTLIKACAKNFAQPVF